MPIERTFGDAPFRGRCGKMTELDDREPTINTPPHLLRLPNRIHEKEQFCLEERRNRVKRCDTTQLFGSHAIAWIHDIADRASETKSWKR